MPNSSPHPCLLVIFGASGDLTKRKLVPSLYDLHCQKQLPERFAILGVSRTEMSDQAFRDHLKESARQFAHNFDEKCWSEFAQLIYYQAGDATKADNYDSIKGRITALQAQYQTCNAIFYLSVSPELYEPTIVQLGAAGMVTEGKAWCSLDRQNRPWQRIVVEKPFGHDPDSAAELNRVLGRVFEEESIYRIDHYLGKEAVQNLLVFRFANSIFEPIWNRDCIDHVQVSALETVGVEGRGGYYDSPTGGAMRDMIQSHLLQVLALVAMEPPVSLSGQDIMVEKTKVLRAARAPTKSEIRFRAVRGQYAPGNVDGKPVPGYRQEKGVNPESQRDTFAALQIFIDTWRWGGVPFYVRSGKRLAKKSTEVVIYFKPTPHALFREQTNPGAGPGAGAGAGSQALQPNRIIINIQPDEGIRLRFEGKVPGHGMNIRSVLMDFDYKEQFHAEPPEAYGTLLLDVMRGDQALFKQRAEIEDAWRIVQPVLDYWDRYPARDLPNYEAGSNGPPAADVMLARDGRHWHNPH